MIDEVQRLRSEMMHIGRIAFQSGLTDTHGGNISVRYNDYILIKKSGSMMGFLAEDDFVTTTVKENPKLDKLASVELKVHRAIYQSLPSVSSVLHVHSPYTIAMSMIEDGYIIPVDSEGKYVLGRVPVLSVPKTISSNEVAKTIPGLLEASRIVVVKSHGPFAVGSSPEEALKFTSILENSCKVKSILLRG